MWDLQSTTTDAARGKHDFMVEDIARKKNHNSLLK